MTVEQRAAAQVARTLQDRLPRAFAVFAVTCAVVGAVECWTYPDRLPTFAALYGIGVAALAVGVWRARRRTTPPRRVVAITALALVVFIATVTAYFVLVRGQIELMALGLVYIVLGAVIVLPWGMVAQSGVVVAAIGGFAVATAFEVPAATPLAVQFVGLLSVAALTIFSARGIERYHLDLLRRDEEKNALLDIARDLTGEFDIDQVFDRIQQRIALLVDCDSVATYFLDRTAGVFRLTSHYGINSDKLQAVQAIPLPGPSPAISGQHDGGAAADPPERPENDPVPRRDLVARFGTRNLFVAPLLLHDASLGFLVAARRRDRPFQADEIRLIDSIARQLSVAIETEKHQRGKQEEAEAGTALARVGRELISALDTPVLLDRLCRVSAEVLHCDVSHALLRDPTTGDYLVRAGHDDDPERADRIRAHRQTSERVRELFANHGDGDLVRAARNPTDERTAKIDPQHEVAVALCVALRRGGELAGYLTLGRFEERPFGHHEERIASGISQVASLALENARLVEELDDANRVKSDFVANMSHELRTPLNVIIGYNDLLLEQAFGPLGAEQMDIIERTGRRARELLDLVNLTLDLSRVEAGDVPLLQREVIVANLLRDLELETRLMRVHPEVEVAWDVPPDLPPLHTDPSKLRVVVRNVVTNALKFTDSGSVHIAVGVLDGGIAITVADTGIGVPADMLEAIFEPFRQVDPTPGRAGGVGLGLHLVRRMLDMLGGRVEVESEVGKGSTFRIWMPLRRGPNEVLHEAS
jgi:signal transduction histidine kinase